MYALFPSPLILQLGPRFTRKAIRRSVEISVLVEKQIGHDEITQPSQERQIIAVMKDVVLKSWIVLRSLLCLT